LISAGCFTDSANYKRKAIMWLIHREQTVNCQILHERTSREFRLPELPRLSVDGYCPNTKAL
jgi:hypothetical protein